MTYLYTGLVLFLMALSGAAAWQWQQARIEKMELADQKALAAANARSAQETDDARAAAQTIAGNLTETITANQADYERQLRNSRRLLAATPDCNAIAGDALGLLREPSGGGAVSKDAAPASSDHSPAASPVDAGTTDWRTVIFTEEQNAESFRTVHAALDSCIQTYNDVRAKVNQEP